MMKRYQKTIKPFGLRLEAQKNELNALTIYGNQNTKTKIRVYIAKANTNFRGLNVQ